MLGLYYDRDGNAIDSDRWSELITDMDYKHVASTTIGGYWVSTVWLGLDHSFGLNSDAPPIIFETMVFAEDTAGAMLDFECVRYATEADARRGHDDMVTLVRATSMTLDDIAPQLDDVRRDTD